MDVRESGLAMLWLRVVARGNWYQRRKMTAYFDAWIAQVKLTERAIKRPAPRKSGRKLRIRG